jgi:hypothetical protein
MASGQDTSFLLPVALWDEHWAGLVLAQDATHRWILLELGYNVRLVTVPHGDTTGWDYGWCYPRDAAAVRKALEGYDPDTQDEPMGWHKRPGPARQAPQRHLEPGYNRPRCRHGGYVGDGCTADPYCPDRESV